MLIKKRGFSLVEIMVVSLILAVISTGLLMTFTSSDLFTSVSLAKADLQANVRLLMYWMVQDVRQTNPLQIDNSNPAPSINHIKFQKVTGINNANGNNTLSTEFTEYDYDPVNFVLTRNLISVATGIVLRSWVFHDIADCSFYTTYVPPLITPLDTGAGSILNTGKLIIVLTGQSIVRRGGLSSPLNFSLTEEVKIRND